MNIRNTEGFRTVLSDSFKTVSVDSREVSMLSEFKIITRRPVQLSGRPHDGSQKK